MVMVSPASDCKVAILKSSFTFFHAVLRTLGYSPEQTCSFCYIYLALRKNGFFE